MGEKINMPEWESIKMGSITDAELNRHFMFLGETGSGKTVSGIMPICRMAFSPKSPRAAALVVDPKGELGDYIETVSGDSGSSRFIRLRPDMPGPVLWLFENVDIEGTDGMKLMEGIMKFADSFKAQKGSIHDRFWVDTASQFLASLVDIDLALYRHPNGKKSSNIRRFWKQFCWLMENLGKSHTAVMSNEKPEITEEHFLGDIRGKGNLSPDDPENMTNNRPRKRSVTIVSGGTEYTEECTFIDMIKNRCLDSDDLEKALCKNQELDDNFLGYRPGNYLYHLNAMALEGASCLSSSARNNFHSMGLDAGEQLYNKFWALLIAFIESYRIDGRKVFGTQARPFRQFIYMSTDTYSSVMSVFSSITHELIAPEFVARISVNPFESPDNRLDVRRIIADGDIVIYNPVNMSAVSSCVGKVLKAGFFKALIVEGRLNNPLVLPFFYICDEFQRFITHDEDSGEQSFLDRCRAYKVCCALATQSIASLRYVFTDERGNHSINIIINNTGTKLFFRTTDTGTANMLTDLIPHPVNQEKPHVVRVRPPTTLQTGECYYILANGMTGRGQVQI